MGNSPRANLLHTDARSRAFYSPKEEDLSLSDARGEGILSSSLPPDERSCSRKVETLRAVAREAYACDYRATRAGRASALSRARNAQFRGPKLLGFTEEEEESDYIYAAV